jgi:hypothetical protein
MAAAQWWRVLESVLKRLIAKPIAKSFAENPAWVEWDKKNLSEKGKKKAAIFIDKLSNPLMVDRLTLGDLLLILSKCVTPNQKVVSTAEGGSRLRLEAANYLAKYREHFTPLMIRRRHEPVLRNENIDFFRNKSAHDATLTLVEASTGRVIAKRLLDALFRPDLGKLGFQLVIVAQ